MAKLKIGDVELDNNIILAPMAGVTNSAFKSIVRSLGAGLICTEMVNDKAVIHANDKTLEMMKIQKMEHPVALQLFGNEVETMVKAAIYMDKHTECDIIDINMGCPAPKIVKNDSGSKLLLHPKKVYEILSAVTKAVDKPVTVKMRIGWDEDNINIIENAINAQNAGVKAIFLHGRTTKQYYSGQADWDIIKAVKEAVNIPVIGNGDIDSPTKAVKLMEYSKVDGIMIGRAALGNPWIFRDIIHYIDTKEILPPPSIGEKIDMAIYHLEKLCEYKPERVAVMEMRGHSTWYLKGIKGANKFKNKLQKCSSKSEMVVELKGIKAYYEGEI